jgi:hypothetical protein
MEKNQELRKKLDEKEIKYGYKRAVKSRTGFSDDEEEVADNANDIEVPVPVAVTKKEEVK